MSEFLLIGLIRCEECKRTMLPVITNKSKRRYYYYKCQSAIEFGRKTCTVREINAQRLECFLIDYLEKVAQNELHIGFIAHKWIFQSEKQVTVAKTICRVTYGKKVM